MLFPWNDWQFWSVTVAALWGAFVIVKQFLPRRDTSSPACGACASGTAAGAKPVPGAEPGEPKLVMIGDRRS